jgi:hypothetical protein
MAGQLLNRGGRRLYLTGSERRAFLAATIQYPREVRTFCGVLTHTGQTSSETSEVGDLCLSFYQRQAESGRLFAHRGDLTGTAPLGIFFGTQIAKWGAMFEPVIDDARDLVGRSHNG